MRFFPQLSRSRVFFLCIVIIFAVVSCGQSQPISIETVDIPPVPLEVPTSVPTLEPKLRDEAISNNNDQQAAAVSLAMPAITAEDAVSSIDESLSGDSEYLEIMWDSLIPSDYTADAIMAKYRDRLVAVEDGTDEALELYDAMQEEFNNAPVNESLSQFLIKIPGFIAPLEYTDDLITEFLLVPYFGACIHQPAPPANQTILVKTAAGQGIDVADSYDPIWVIGELKTEAQTTELATAGYNIADAMIEKYTP